MATTYVALGALLAVHGLREGTAGAACAARVGVPLLRRLGLRWPRLLPVALGLFAGLGWCPPLALAFADAVHTGSPLGGAVFLLAFYLGTALFLLPLPGLAVWYRHRHLRVVARLASGVVGADYLYRGVLLALEILVTP
jgi:sulfite exporter TauE/SafE